MIEQKKNYFDTKTERAVLVGLRKPATSRQETDDHMAELRELVRTAGADVAGQIIQERISPNSAYFIGKGKLEYLQEVVEEEKAQLVVFDDELTPAQVKNISKVLPEIKIIDRTSLILDIFADHAKSNEAKTQVELAQLNYMLPRLTRAWQHLSRQNGGIGTKGPGETQLETDKRLVRTRISKLKERLKVIERQDQTRRQKRDKMYRVALIGYTNAGKSTLMKALTNADVLVEDKLFATLDTTVRRVEIAPSLSVLMSDTVGFIRKLPHQLVASFRSTLAESDEADLLLHVVDISHPQYEEHIDVVNTLLNDMKNNKTPRLLVFNKIDALENPSVLQHLRTRFENAVFVSAQRHLGLNNLRDAVVLSFDSAYKVKDIRLDFTHGASEHLVHPFAQILEKKYDEQFIYLKVKYHNENEYRLKQVLEQYSGKELCGF